MGPWQYLSMQQLWHRYMSLLRVLCLETTPPVGTFVPAGINGSSSTLRSRFNRQPRGNCERSPALIKCNEAARPEL